MWQEDYKFFHSWNQVIDGHSLWYTVFNWCLMKRTSKNKVGINKENKTKDSRPVIDSHNQDNLRISLHKSSIDYFKDVFRLFSKLKINRRPVITDHNFSIHNMITISLHLLWIAINRICFMTWIFSTHNTKLSYCHCKIIVTFVFLSFKLILSRIKY